MAVVSGSAGREAKGGGSLIRKLIRSAPVPVLFLHDAGLPPVTAEKGFFYHPVFATDWSGASKTALRYVLNLKAIIEMLEIVHVMNRRFSVRDMRNLKQQLAETRGVFLEEGIDAEAHVYAGKRPDEILLAARDYGATAVIMGASDRHRLKRLFSRSCTLCVAESLELPVLVIPWG